VNEKRPCKNCQDGYKAHIDYTFTEYMEGDLTSALTKALPNVRCTRYKPMTNLEYLEYESIRRDLK
jgi:hypothetical protein